MVWLARTRFKDQIRRLQNFIGSEELNQLSQLSASARNIKFISLSEMAERDNDIIFTPASEHVAIYWVHYQKSTLKMQIKESKKHGTWHSGWGERSSPSKYTKIKSSFLWLHTISSSCCLLLVRLILLLLLLFWYGVAEFWHWGPVRDILRLRFEV